MQCNQCMNGDGRGLMVSSCFFLAVYARFVWGSGWFGDGCCIWTSLDECECLGLDSRLARYYPYLCHVLLPVRHSSF
ncbi:hypothetical protein HDV57DRAFT_500962 [Trichoderma longibrachiatum]